MYNLSPGIRLLVSFPLETLSSIAFSMTLCFPVRPETSLTVPSLVSFANSFSTLPSECHSYLKLDPGPSLLSAHLLHRYHPFQAFETIYTLVIAKILSPIKPCF